MISKLFFVAVLIQCVWPLSSRAENESLNFPIRDATTISIGKSNLLVQLLDLPGKGATGFAWSVMRDGYLVKIEIIDGIGPEIQKNPTSFENKFGVLYKAGANQSVFDLISMSNSGLDNMQKGLISSNLSCIYNDGNNVFVALSEHRGTIVLDQFKVSDENIKLIKTQKIRLSMRADAMRQCDRSFFRSQ